MGKAAAHLTLLEPAITYYITIQNKQVLRSLGKEMTTLKLPIVFVLRIILYIYVLCIYRSVKGLYANTPCSNYTYILLNANVGEL